MCTNETVLFTSEMQGGRHGLCNGDECLLLHKTHKESYIMQHLPHAEEATRIFG